MKNFKIRCLFGNGIFTEGKIYEVVNGKLRNDSGFEYEHVSSVNHWNEWMIPQFELVEEKQTPFQYMLEYYDLKVGEVFLLNGLELHFNENCSLFDKYNLGANELLNSLVNCTAKVEKLTWKPKDNDKVWKIDAEGFVYEGSFTESLLSNIALLKLGWIFPTKEEAERNKDRVLAEMKEVLNGTD